MDFYLEHYVRGLLGHDREPDGLRSALHALADASADSPRRILCHRDFHSRNLLLRNDGSVAMVDIQDARWGPDSYDLASILRDAYLEFPETWIDPLVTLYVDRAAVADSEDFRARFDIVSCQRMIKALGTFGSLRDSRDADRYLNAIPRTLERLRRLLPLQGASTELFRLMAADRLLSP
jgi:aminoglycoside/choline kinase family phosphotransferase